MVSEAEEDQDQGRYNPITKWHPTGKPLVKEKIDTSPQQPGKNEEYLVSNNHGLSPSHFIAVTCVGANTPNQRKSFPCYRQLCHKQTPSSIYWQLVMSSEGSHFKTKTVVSQHPPFYHKSR